MPKGGNGGGKPDKGDPGDGSQSGITLTDDPDVWPDGADNSGDDIVRGLGGNDTIDGGEGDDYLYGNDGNDTLNGEAGNDFLFGDAGDDILNGGGGNDFFLADRGDDTIDGGAGFDQLSFNSGGSFIFVNFTNAQVTAGGYTVDANTIYVERPDGTTEEDTVTNVEWVWGTSGDDFYFGSDADELFQARSGNDTLVGNGGSDELTGGTGDDTFVFNLGDFANGETDIITAKESGDVIDLSAFDPDDITVESGLKLGGKGKSDTLITIDNGTDVGTIEVWDVSLTESDLFFG